MKEEEHLTRVQQVYPDEIQTTSSESESSYTSLPELHTAVEEFTNNMVTDMDGLDLASTWLDDVEIAIANVLAEPPRSETLSIEQPTTFHTETGISAFVGCLSDGELCTAVTEEPCLHTADVGCMAICCDEECSETASRFRDISLLEDSCQTVDLIGSLSSDDELMN